MTTERYHVCYADTDAGGVVYHARYLEMAERGRNALLRGLDYSLRSLEQGFGILFVVRRIAMDFRAPAVLEDVLDLDTTLKSLRPARSVWTTSISRCQRLLCLVEAEIVCLHAARRELCPMPVAIMESLRRYRHSTACAAVSAGF